MTERIWWVLVFIGRGLAGQTQYHNLDAGRPGRVEDADPLARYAVDVDLAPFQLERFSGGTTRYRAEPKIGYGVLPFTDIQLRLPLIQVSPPARSGAVAAAGLAGPALGMMHAFNLETSDVPQIAVAGEVSLPLGNLAPTSPSYLLKGLVTKTTAVGRIHLNAGGGTFAVRPPATAGSGCSGFSSFRIQSPGDTTCGGTGPPIIFDSPCRVSPADAGRFPPAAAQMCLGATRMPDSSGVAAPRYTGGHWFAGVAADHAFPLRSTMVSADLFAEHFIGLYPSVDWTAEVGVRHQLTPLLVVDAGAGWHFAGAIHSALATVGATYEFATKPVGR